MISKYYFFDVKNILLFIYFIFKNQSLNLMQLWNDMGSNRQRRD